jgi:hypothetical protein
MPPGDGAAQIGPWTGPGWLADGSGIALLVGRRRSVKGSFFAGSRKRVE